MLSAFLCPALQGQSCAAAVGSDFHSPPQTTTESGYRPSEVTQAGNGTQGDNCCERDRKALSSHHSQRQCCVTEWFLFPQSHPNELVFFLSL